MLCKKRPVIVEAITFDEFVQYGLDNTEGPILNGMPMTFNFKGHIVTRCDKNSYTVPTLEGNYKFTRDDMLMIGVRGEIYPCKINIFNETYDIVENIENTGLDFGEALKLMKQGKKLARRGWNGKGMFVVYQKGYPNGIPCNKQTAEAWGMKEGELFKCDPYLQISTTDGSHAMWVPSIRDCLANDWSVINLVTEEDEENIKYV